MSPAEPAISVLGASGMLGTDVVSFLRKNYSRVEAFDLPDFDITKCQDLESAVTGKDIIINCAAYTNVEKAEAEERLAYAVNAEAVKMLGRAAKATGAYVLHISTDFVFDGKIDRPYTETDEPNPVNAYGRSKLAGEKLLIGSGANFSIIRIEWTYGKNGNNFIKKLLAAALSGQALKVVDDQIGSPTATTEVVKSIYQLMKQKAEGIFHFAAEGFTSRYEMAKYMFKNLGIKVDLTSCKSSKYPTMANRPLNSSFCCNKISNILEEPIKKWQKPLETFLRQL